MSDWPAIRTHPEGEPQLPDGQVATTKWPVLTYGPTPLITREHYRIRVWGACATPLDLDWNELTERLAFVRVGADMHCVTTWSRFAMRWGGWRVRDLLALAQPLPEATHVMQHAYGDYTTNTSLADLLDDDVLIATEESGTPIDKEHGGPARVVVPRLWAWKGAKWVNGFEILTHDRRGFWEVNGYHNHADPWGPGGERYSHQEQAQATRKRGNELRRR